MALADLARMGRTLHDLEHLLGAHLERERPTLAHVAPADARLLRRGQERLSGCARALAADAAARCTTRAEEPPSPHPAFAGGGRPAVLPDAIGGLLFSFSGTPGGLVAGDGVVFVSDSTSGTVWRIALGLTTARLVDPVMKGAGEDGPRRISDPAGRLSLAPEGTLYVAEPSCHRIWAVAPGQEPRVVAGTGDGYRDAQGTGAQFRFPGDVVVADDGAGYVADTGNNAIRRVTPGGDVTTLAGAPPDEEGDATGCHVGLHWSTGICPGDDQSVWVADHGRAAIRRIDRHGRGVTHLRLGGPPCPSVVAVVDAATIAVEGSALDGDLAPFGWVALVGTAAAEPPGTAARRGFLSAGAHPWADRS